jgi:DNA-binding ferritin-like protein (Dps family)
MISTAIASESPTVMKGGGEKQQPFSHQQSDPSHFVLKLNQEKFEMLKNAVSFLFRIATPIEGKLKISSSNFLLFTDVDEEELETQKIIQDILSNVAFLSKSDILQIFKEASAFQEKELVEEIRLNDVMAFLDSVLNNKSEHYASELSSEKLRESALNLYALIVTFVTNPKIKQSQFNEGFQRNLQRLKEVYGKTSGSDFSKSVVGFRTEQHVYNIEKQLLSIDPVNFENLRTASSVLFRCDHGNVSTMQTFAIPIFGEIDADSQELQEAAQSIITKIAGLSQEDLYQAMKVLYGIDNEDDERAREDMNDNITLKDVINFFHACATDTLHELATKMRSDRYRESVVVEKDDPMIRTTCAAYKSFGVVLTALLETFCVHKEATKESFIAEFMKRVGQKKSKKM